MARYRTKCGHLPVDRVWVRTRGADLEYYVDGRGEGAGDVSDCTEYYVEQGTAPELIDAIQLSLHDNADNREFAGILARAAQIVIRRFTIDPEQVESITD